jgi:hypothetical protein
MEPMYYIGLDVHKRKISYCMKDSSSAEGSPPATRMDLDHCGVDRNLAPTEPLSLFLACYWIRSRVQRPRPVQ